MKRFWIIVIVMLLVLDAAAVTELWRVMGEKPSQPDKVAANEGKAHSPSRATMR